MDIVNKVETCLPRTEMVQGLPAGRVRTRLQLQSQSDGGQVFSGPNLT